VQSSPFPFFAARRQPPGAARRGGPGGGLVGWGPQGSLPDPAHLGPIYEKSRFQDVKLLCSKPKGATSYKPPGEPGAPEEPPSYRSWVLQLEVADWVSFDRL
jgi:hypothetical protein